MNNKLKLLLTSSAILITAPQVSAGPLDYLRSFSPFSTKAHPTLNTALIESGENDKHLKSSSDEYEVSDEYELFDDKSFTPAQRAETDADERLKAEFAKGSPEARLDLERDIFNKTNQKEGILGWIGSSLEETLKETRASFATMLPWGDKTNAVEIQRCIRKAQGTENWKETAYNDEGMTYLSSANGKEILFTQGFYDTQDATGTHNLLDQDDKKGISVLFDMLKTNTGQRATVPINQTGKRFGKLGFGGERMHWTCLELTVEEVNGVKVLKANLVDSTGVINGGLYSNDELKKKLDIVAKQTGLTLEFTTELTGVQGLFNHNDCGRFIMERMILNGSGTGRTTLTPSERIKLFKHFDEKETLKDTHNVKGRQQEWETETTMGRVSKWVRNKLGY